MGLSLSNSLKSVSYIPWHPHINALFFMYVCMCLARDLSAVAYSSISWMNLSSWWRTMPLTNNVFITTIEVRLPKNVPSVRSYLYEDKRTDITTHIHPSIYTKRARIDMTVCVPSEQFYNECRQKPLPDWGPFLKPTSPLYRSTRNHVRPSVHLPLWSKYSS